MSYNFVRHRFKGHEFKKHFHTTYSIGLIVNGVHRLEFENEDTVSSCGDIKIVNPYDMHLADGNVFWEYFNFMPTQNLIKEIAQNMCEKHIDFDIKFSHNISDKYASKLLLELFNSDDMNKEENMVFFISYLLQNYSSKKIKSVKIDKNINHSIEFLHENFLNDISLDFIAKQSNLSKYHFIKIFKKQIGITPHQYILALKIEYAKTLINLKMPLSQIAYECGFSDQSHFIRTYKKMHGFTPKIKNRNFIL